MADSGERLDANPATQTTPGTDPDSVRWGTRRRPHGRLLRWTVIVGLVVGLLGASLVRLLMIEPNYGFLTLVVILVAGAMVMTMLHGAGCAVTHQGELHYGYGGAANLSMPIGAIKGWAMIEVGLLHGVGVIVDPNAVTFLNKRGPSYAKMQEYHERLGVNLVLEFLTEEDLAALRGEQMLLTGSSAPRVDQPEPDLDRLSDTTIPKVRRHSSRHGSVS